MGRFKKKFSLWTFTKTVAIESESEIYPSGGPNSQDPKQALGPGTVLGGPPQKKIAGKSISAWDPQSSGLGSLKDNAKPGGGG